MEPLVALHLRMNKLNVYSIVSDAVGEIIKE